jgi:hypothetical protein
MSPRAKAAKSRKITLSLRHDVLAALAEAVAQGAAPSKTALVDRAIRHELKKIRRRIMAAEWERAAKDPLFMRDVQEIEKAFKTADAETARSIR